MKQTEEEIRQILEGRRILIIEDDRDLGPRLERLFRTFGAKDVVVRRCVHGANCGGLNYLLVSADTIDLLCVDVMLPWNEANLKECDRLNSQWSELQEKIRELREKGATEWEIAERRAELTELSESIRALIDRDAGTKMIREWWNEMTRINGTHWLPPTAIMFLTARQQPSVQPEADDIVQRAQWVNKPAMDIQVLSAAAELLEQLDNRQRG